MSAQSVTAEELEAVVVAKGYMPKGMPLRDYPEDFVSAVLIGAWPQVMECITVNRLN